MVETAPIHITYNLNRLGQTGDEIAFSANADERAGLARLAGGLDVPKFTARIRLQKSAANRFTLSYELAAELIQACAVTLEPVVARITRDFTRELHFVPHLKREAELTIDPEAEEGPEEITSLHYDLAGPLLEEFVLGLEPYPRAPGVTFEPPADPDGRPESPFAVLKDLKISPKSTK